MILIKYFRSIRTICRIVFDTITTRFLEFLFNWIGWPLLYADFIMYTFHSVRVSQFLHLWLSLTILLLGDGNGKGVVVGFPLHSSLGSYFFYHAFASLFALKASLWLRHLAEYQGYIQCVRPYKVWIYLRNTGNLVHE